MNKVILVGRLTKDPEIRYTQQGKAVASFTLAVNRRFKNKNGENEADFIPIVVWGVQAENAGKYLGKGSQIALSGRIEVSNYEKDGNKRYVTKVVAEEVQYLSKSKTSNATNNNQDYGAPMDDFTPMSEDDDDLPF